MTTTMQHPSIRVTAVAVPDRFIVVDGNVYWVDGRNLMHAPMSGGQIVWQDGGIVESPSPEVADMIAARLTTTFTLIDLAHQEA